MLTKISSIYLYTGIQVPAIPNSDSSKAKAHMDEILEGKYIWLNYADPNQFSQVFEPISTWFFANIDGTMNVERFPFVIYTEEHDDLDSAYWPRIILYGLDEIKEAGLEALYQLGR